MFKQFLIAFVVYLLLRFFYGIWKFRSVVKKSMQEMKRHNAGTPDGEIHVQNKKGHNQRRLDDDAEYVDYEEIE